MTCVGIIGGLGVGATVHYYEKITAACKARGVGVGTSAGSTTRIRAVTHLDVNRADIDAALKVINDVMAA